MRTILVAALCLVSVLAMGCSNKPAPASRSAESRATPTLDSNVSRQNAPLPDPAYKAELSLTEQLTTLRAGEKKIIKVKVKNASPVQWIVYGTQPNTIKYRVAVGNGWLDSSQKLITKMDGRYGLPADLPAGQEVEVPLQITAPAKPGEYYLQLDMVQELVTWFEEKGSPVLKVKVNVQ